jgi:hypothetical protein
MGLSVIGRAAAAAAAVLLALSLTACDDEPEVERSPDVTGSGSPIPSETSSLTDSTPTGPVEPTLPAEAEKATRAGAEAFVEYYWDVVNYAQATGDVALLSSLAEPSCGACEGGVDLITRVYDRGGRISGVGYEVKRLESSRSPSGHWTIVVYTRAGDQVIKGAGDLDQEFPGGPAKWLMGVSQVRGAWSITTLEDT